MQTLIETHTASIIILDDDGIRVIREVRLGQPRTGEIGFNILKEMCDKGSAPAYIETFYSESPCAGRVTHKNKAMKQWQKRANVTAYR